MHVTFVSRRRLAITIAAFTALLLGGSAALGLWLGWSGHKVKAETVRDYTLEIVPKDIDYGNGAVWHAWTFNGTVPGRR